tara:strand:- start:603 stop:959 length:357 start_codon:yes stop_codon:yes gene_type:complete
MFNYEKETVQLLGRWQPWHNGHTELFKRAIKKTGQVAILIRQMPINENNPYTGGQVAEKIQQVLDQEGYVYNQDYVIINVPNITNITYGREVGYTITKETLSKEIENISATKIRQGQL